ncbi:hypothetical protein ACFSL6_09635 [Paenibacillus thailandensis]|uniref:rRNA methyltransferase n=1 Tax=Paenibacillus thailandensis TaxID=393250 RepID=A0ABW5R121_9BACL
MEYIFEREAKNYEDLASGRVLYNAQGTTAFPVRLASEIVQRCFRILEHKGEQGPYSVYDPCCGGAYLLTVIGLLHGNRISAVYGSDINPEALRTAEKNLSLLTANGLNNRKEQIQEYVRQYGKSSHREALKSTDRLTGNVANSRIGNVTLFQSDITQQAAPEAIEPKNGVNLIITDLPYGDIVTWESESADPLARLFDNAYERLLPGRSVLAVVADKSQKLQHGKFRRIQYAKVGKRQFGIFEPLPRTD